MVKFMMKCFFITTILLFGVLLGMQQANEGMKKMRGLDDPSLQGAFNITDNGTGDVEASVLGIRVNSHDIEEKQRKLEQTEAFNLFTSIGKKLAEGVSMLLEKLLFVVSSSIDGIIDKF
ncbi:YqxA family protein [Cytobacillus sp. S13-E01]|uniref:YqxA family protein n=1 Tax=Cytobacillus sp. S13-E01 TaxID=3031326 RepID=UPI0023D8019C|nr:YqxA family protein [Cytobacillus sp. S13-E01]MDF0727235.1 YqxA family protein [Cytobacillus sp. S13-E01]